MSSINILIDQDLEVEIADKRDKWFTGIVDKSAKILDKKESEIIIRIEKYLGEEVANMPDILIRAETSVFCRDLIKEWGDELLSFTREILGEALTNKRVAVKTYVIDSEWTEEIFKLSSG